MIADAKRGYWSTNAPLLIRNHLIVGVAGDFDNLPGILKSFDPDTGKLQWTFYSTPAPGMTEPASGGATGGQMWMTGTYDPELNLMYVGTGNPTPVLNGPARPGDNPWTCSIVALNPDTGKLAWGFQASPHDTHDWDAAEVPVLVDGDVQRRAAQAACCRPPATATTSCSIARTARISLTSTFATVELGERHRQGRPSHSRSRRRNPRATDGWSRRTKPAPRTIARRASIRRPGLLIVSAQDAYGIYFFKPDHGAYGWAGANYSVYGRAALRAIDYPDRQDPLEPRPR